MTAEASTMDVALQKPQVDQWNYRFLRLGNQIEAILISDPKADKASAAVDVHVGSMKDPDGLPGLAHFTEHMLFYASSKYPNEDEFSKWVNDHGGRSNAYTAAEHTNYYFSINADALEPTLDRFAQFFTAPLISADGIERERNAVNSEHDGNTNNDAWRQMQLWKLAGDPAHPYTRFFTGNMATLGTRPKAAGVDVHEAVKAFHSEHYSANRMRLAVMGRESVDELQAIVERTFSDVPDKGLQQTEAPHADLAIYGPEHVGRVIYATPMNDGHEVSMKWVIPRQRELWREAPASFLAHLIGHEGKGSLFALLKDKGWVKSLTAGDYAPIADTSLFTISMSLTDAGHANLQHVWTHCFQYIELLKQPGGLTREHFDDNAALKRLAFNFRENPSSSYTSLLAGLMHEYPLEHLLEVAYHVPFEYDEAATRAVLDCLTPANAMMMWASKSLDVDCSETEEWYGQKYKIERLPQEWLESWNSPGVHPELHLPEVNPFTPTDLALVSEDSEAPATPQQLCDDGLVSFWYKTHLEFRAPKMSLRLRFILPAAFASPEAYMCTALYKALITSALNELAYPAELAGLHYSVQMQTGQAGGLQVSMGGYSDKMIVLLERVAALLTSFTVLPDRLAVEKERYRDSMRNRDRQSPYYWTLDLAEVLLNTDSFHVDDVLAVLPGIEVEDVQHHIDRVLFRHARVEGLVLGNVDERGAAAISAVARDVLTARASRPIVPCVMDRARLVRLHRASHFKWGQPGRNGNDVNSAHLSLYQVAAQHDVKAAMMAALVEQVGSRDAFHELRTVQQIGYVVHMYSSPSNGVPHVGVVLQSSSLSAAAMDAAVHRFLHDWRSRLDETLTEAVFKEHVEELAKSLLEKVRSNNIYIQRWFREILISRFAWDIVDRSVAELRTVTRAEFMRFVDEVFGADRARLTVDIRGSAESAAAAPTNGVQSENSSAEGPGAKDDAAGEICGADNGNETAAGVNGDVAASQETCGAASANGVQGGVQNSSPELEVTLVEDWATFRQSMPLWPAHRRVW